MRFPIDIVTRQLGTSTLALKQHSPTLFFAGGVAGIIGTTVLACRATLKLEETLDENRSTLNEVKHFQDTKYSEEDRKQDTVILYIRSVVSVAKLYAPAVLLGSASIAMLAHSHNTLIKRNAALTAAYTALDKGFRTYRARVVEKYGEDEDRELRYGTEKVKEKDKTTGKKKTISRVGPDGASIYAKWYDQFNPNWSKDPVINRLFLRSQQNFMNDLLHARGHVFLNEVYEALGFDHSSTGAVVGWRITTDGEGDNFIDFGIFHSNVDNEIRDFVNGKEGSVLLDFNVDGLIYDKIENFGERLSWQRNR